MSTLTAANAPRKNSTTTLIDPVFDLITGLGSRLATISFQSTIIPVPDCKDEGFLVLIALLQKESILCSAIKQYTLDLLNLSLPFKKDDSGPSQLDGVREMMLKIMQDFKIKLIAIKQIEPFDILEDGLESYLTSLLKEKLYHRHMRREVIQEQILARKIILLNSQNAISCSSISSLKIEETLKQAIFPLFRLEAKNTPIAKLEQMERVLEIIQSSHSTPDAMITSDVVLDSMVWLILRAGGLNLVSSLRCCEKLRLRITGRESFLLVTLDAAISYILTYPLNNPEDIPEDIKLLVEYTSHSTTPIAILSHKSIMETLSKAFWEASSSSGSGSKVPPPALPSNSHLKTRLTTTVQHFTTNSSPKI